MKRTTEKGFTLIELLAVIVILAIIALIAVPVIMNIINKANKSAFKDTAYGVISAGELYFAERQLEPDGMLEDVTINLPDETKTLELKGTVPKGSITISKEGKTALAVQNGRYCITKGFDDKDLTVIEDYERCELTLPPKTLSEIAVVSEELGITEVNLCAKKDQVCEVNKEETVSFAIRVNDTETYKFYVLNDDGNEITLIMNENLGDNVKWDTSINSQGPKIAVSELKARTSK